MTADLAYLQSVHDELTRAGAGPGSEFFVHGVTPGPVGSESYGLLLHDDGRAEVYYSDRGRDRPLVVTADRQQARALLVDKVLTMAGRMGRGPKAGPPPAFTAFPTRPPS